MISRTASTFAAWMMEMITADEGFLSKILFVDEANFNRNGSVNTRNSHVWAEENQHALLEINTQRQFSTNIWAGDSWRQDYWSCCSPSSLRRTRISRIPTDTIACSIRRRTIDCAKRHVVHARRCTSTLGRNSTPTFKCIFRK